MRIVLAVLGLFFLCLSSVNAAPVRALPALVVQGANITEQQVNQLSPNKKWVLVYINRKCKHCEDVLHILDSLPDQLKAKKVVLIIGGEDVPTTKDWLKSYSQVSSSDWWVDTTLSLIQELSLKNMPVAMGIMNGQVMWTHPGMAKDPQTMRSLISDWAP